MQQAAASGQYGVGSVPQFGGGGSAARTSHAHVLGISHESAAPPTPHHLHQNQNQNQQLLQHSAQVGQQQQQKADSLNEIPPPIASRAPLRSAASYENLMPSSGGGGGGGGGQFGEEEALAGDEGGERGGLGSVGNRWPRQETLALLKIRSEMDATFRDASLKGPLWEDVSRKLAELGYHRSAKKCKEKFENVHKYYKRTKDGRAGRQDGKSYRFFSQLEALHSNNNNNNSTSANVNHARNSNHMQAMTSGPGPARLIQPSASAPGPLPPPALLSNNANAIGGEMNRNCGTDANPVAIRHSADFSAGNLSFSSETSDEDDYEEQTDSRKRKRSSGGGAVKKMMLFFEHLMKQVMEKQEMMQQKFLETIEKREQDRMIREEAWKRQEMTRLHREHEIMAQERALSASRDAALISFLHKVTGQTFQVPSMTPHAQSTTSINPVPPVHETYHHHHHHHHDDNNNSNINNNDPDVGAIMNVNTNLAEQMELSFDANSNRWPKTEVHALIKLRSAMEARYQDAGPKGPLWEEISAGMSRLGYNRSSKRCKEKWENINKYFKKVKESNKKRPEDAKTCPYFHQLDQLYRKRIVGRGSSVPGKQEQIDVVACMDNNKDGTQIQGSGTEQILAIMPPLDNNNNNNNGVDASNDGATIPTSNGEVHTTFYSRREDGKGAADQRSLKKVKMKPQNPNFSSFDDGVLVNYFGAGKPFNSNDLKSYVLKPESLVMEDVMDMDDDDMQSAEHHHHHNHHDQQSMVDDYDDKIEGEDSDNNNENEQQENHHSRHNNNIPTIASGSNSTNDRQSGGVDHLPFAQFVHDNRTGSSVSIAASTAANSSFIAMVHRLAVASEPPDFKSSKA